MDVMKIELYNLGIVSHFLNRLQTYFAILLLLPSLKFNMKVFLKNIKKMSKNYILKLIKIHEEVFAKI